MLAARGERGRGRGGAGMNSVTQHGLCHQQLQQLHTSGLGWCVGGASGGEVNPYKWIPNTPIKFRLSVQTELHLRGPSLSTLQVWTPHTHLIMLLGSEPDQLFICTTQRPL